MIGLDTEERDRPAFQPEPATRPAPAREERADDVWDDDDWEEDWLFL
ncbi:hypothetical protein [Sandaracinus amylolyticus]|uniref:Uncharacterized protein n=1 Tax=Sandaracinus amylolyticus TaxID=927083 RepID=A0A0F6SHN3_9BACT|nr:hypothetical protein [Sandaracinus amylolyticus]AKF10744.1 hypothetical protein DB32_007893 [Sandaracinus amylolyticus]